LSVRIRYLGDEPSEIDEVKGTEPVRRTVMTPRVNNAMPRDLEKYSSRATNVSFDGFGAEEDKRVGSRTSGERSVTMMVGEMINGTLCRASHPADP
jgi:hypothetical protein